VRLSLEVVDLLSNEVMRGFGAVRKRGAEVGGLLLGSIEEGSPTVVRIDGFQPVPCEYRTGPSYQFSEEDSVVFEEAFQRASAVGYYRSHTRDGLTLAPEDLELLDYFFPSSEHIALLIKPYVTSACSAGIFVRENGSFSQTTPLVFPFRRNEMLGAEPPQRRPLMERKPRPTFIPDAGRADAGRPERVAQDLARLGAAAVEQASAPLPEVQSTPAIALLSWSPVIWLTLVCFLALGGFLGFHLARSIPAAAPEGTYSLSLRVARAGENLNLTWNGESPITLAARNGILEIEDGPARKSIDLDAAQLRNGRLIYRNNSKQVRFRLTMSPEARVSVTQTTEWGE